MIQRHGLVVTHVLLSLLAAVPARGQGMDEELRRTVVELDELVFAAFNRRDLDRFMIFFSDDLEFYHDTDGVSGHAEMVANSRRLFSQDSPLRRELVDGSMEVHAVPGYGAIQVGRHEFCHWEAGARDCGVFGFLHLWRHHDGRWQITRVFSYGH
jgi:hypothetical protein